MDSFAIGFTINEKSDQATKRACLHQIYDTYTETSCSELETSIKLYANLWTGGWRSKNNNKLKEIIPDLLATSTKGMCRRKQVVVARLRIGHANLTHEHLLKKTPPKICYTCDFRLKVEHTIYIILYSNRKVSRFKYTIINNKLLCESESIKNLFSCIQYYFWYNQKFTYVNFEDKL